MKDFNWLPNSLHSSVARNTFMVHKNISLGQNNHRQDQDHGQDIYSIPTYLPFSFYVKSGCLWAGLSFYEKKSIKTHLNFKSLCVWFCLMFFDWFKNSSSNFLKYLLWSPPLSLESIKSTQRICILFFTLLLFVLLPHCQS